MPLCFLYKCNLWHCAFVLMKSEYERHISQRTLYQQKTRKRIAQSTEDTVYAVWKYFILQLVVAFNYFWLKCDYCAFVYYMESTCLTFYTFCSGPSRACLVVWVPVLLLYCLKNKIVSHVCLSPRIHSFLYVFGIWLERLGKVADNHDMAEHGWKSNTLIKECSL